MKILMLAVFSVLVTLNQAIMFSTVATLSLTLINLNKPVSGFFGIFRRRKSPIQETTIPTEVPTPFSMPNQPVFGGFNPFGFGGGSPFFPGFGGPVFGMFGPSNRFPPQMRPQMKPMRPGIPQQPNPAMPMFPGSSQQQFVPQQMPSDVEASRDPRGDDVPGMNTEEAESFFTLLSETDESKCISRLVCEMGANPQSGGEFGQTVVEIIGSLNDFPDGSKVSEYNEILSLGMAEGLSACLSKFSVCDEESYQLVKKAQVEGE